MFEKALLAGMLDFEGVMNGDGDVGELVVGDPEGSGEGEEDGAKAPFPKGEFARPANPLPPPKGDD